MEITDKKNQESLNNAHEKVSVDYDSMYSVLRSPDTATSSISTKAPSRGRAATCNNKGFYGQEKILENVETKSNLYLCLNALN